ncbi:MAG: PUA domain-containing protein [Candidatus Freyarchaeota archaeon]
MDGGGVFLEAADYWTLRRIRLIADYQFFPGAGRVLFPDGVRVVFSSKTGRVRQVYLDGDLVASFRPDEGTFALNIRGGELLLEHFERPTLRVIVTERIAGLVVEGRNVFAKHVVAADPEIRPWSEVLVVDEADKLAAVGRAVLNGEEMVAFSRGVAVKTRIGNPRFKSKEGMV